MWPLVGNTGNSRGKALSWGSEGKIVVVPASGEEAVKCDGLEATVERVTMAWSITQQLASVSPKRAAEEREQTRI